MIAATAGVVVRSGSAIANTLFHSTGGGATEDNENVFTSATGKIVACLLRPIPGLSRTAHRDRSTFDECVLRETWNRAGDSYAQLSAIFGADAAMNVGSLTGLDLVERRRLGAAHLRHASRQPRNEAGVRGRFLGDF